MPGAKLRVVLDTNIYVAAFGHPKGNNARLFAAAPTARYHLLVSPAIVRELARVLRSALQWQDERVQKAVRVVAQVVEIVVPCTGLNVIAADPDDNRRASRYNTPYRYSLVASPLPGSLVPGRKFGGCEARNLDLREIVMEVLR